MAVATALIGGAALFGAYSSVQSGQQQESIAKQNQAAANVQASQIEQEAAYEAKKRRELGVRTIASNRAAASVSGLSVDVGTDLWLQQNIATEFEKDATAILAQGLNKATSIRTRGSIYGAQGGYAATAGTTGAMSSLLQGASNIYGLNTKAK